MPDPSAAVESVLAAVRDAFAAAAPLRRDSGTPLRVVVGLSGGRDSIALLDALARIATELRIVLSAAHVHHGLSPHADAWATFCTNECAARHVPIAVHRVHVERAGGQSLEAMARAARYAALATIDADIIALAHHADDQAETMLLQLLRGAGPPGLAAMPVQRSPGAGAALFRPLLALPRTVIDAYAQARGLEWVDDESNADLGVKRNYIRHDVAPRLASAFPGYPATLVRAAAHQAEAAQLADDLAQLDARELTGRGSPELTAPDGPADMTLDRAALAALYRRAPYRARNVFRWFLRQHDLRAPSAARLAAMLEQLALAPPDARVRLRHGAAEIGFYRGRVVVHAPAIAPFTVAWHGETAVTLPHGTLEFTSCVGAGIARAALEETIVTIRSRAGGERLRTASGRPPRSLKRLLQEAAIPFWQRDRLPLVFCGEALALVPGIGIDPAFEAGADTPGCSVQWYPS